MTTSTGFDLSNLGSDITDALSQAHFYTAITAVITAGVAVMAGFWGIPKLVGFFKTLAKK